jgi:hypothetical protein
MGQPPGESMRRGDEHGEGKGREGKREREREEAHSHGLPVLLLLLSTIITIYYYTLDLLLSPLNCPFALCHTATQQHLSPSSSRALTSISNSSSPSSSQHTHTRFSALTRSDTTSYRPQASLVSQLLSSRPPPLWQQQPYHLWSPMRSAQ